MEILNELRKFIQKQRPKYWGAPEYPGHPCVHPVTCSSLLDAPPRIIQNFEIRKGQGFLFEKKIALKIALFDKLLLQF